MRRMFSLKQLEEIADVRVKSLVEGGTLENAKPIYWHSCTLKRITSGEPDALEYYYDFIIINNSATPLTKESLIEWLHTNPTIEIKVVQGYNASDSDGLVSFFTGDADVEQTINTHVIDLATGSVQIFTQSVGPATFSDNGVNKIN